MTKDNMPERIWASGSAMAADLDSPTWGMWEDEDTGAEGLVEYRPASTLTHLEEENARLREALQMFVGVCTDERRMWTGMHWIDACDLKHAYDSASAALSATGEDAG